MALGRGIFGAALLIGGGVLAFTAIVAAPRLLRVARPAVREAVRRGLGAYERARHAIVQAAEDVEDIVAEVRAERGTNQAETAPPGDARKA